MAARSRFFDTFPLFHITASQFNKLAWLLTILALFGLFIAPIVALSDGLKMAICGAAHFFTLLCVLFAHILHKPFLYVPFLLLKGLLVLAQALVYPYMLYCMYNDDIDSLRQLFQCPELTFRHARFGWPLFFVANVLLFLLTYAVYRGMRNEIAGTLVVRRGLSNGQQRYSIQTDSIQTASAPLTQPIITAGGK
jgi:hypothetical protein